MNDHDGPILDFGLSEPNPKPRRGKAKHFVYASKIHGQRLMEIYSQFLLNEVFMPRSQIFKQ